MPNNAIFAPFHILSEISMAFYRPDDLATLLAGEGKRGYFESHNLQNWLKKPPILTVEMESAAFFAAYRRLKMEKVNTL